MPFGVSVQIFFYFVSCCFIIKHVFLVLPHFYSCPFFWAKHRSHFSVSLDVRSRRLSCQVRVFFVGLLMLEPTSSFLDQCSMTELHSKIPETIPSTCYICLSVKCALLRGTYNGAEVGCAYLSPSLSSKGSRKLCSIHIQEKLHIYLAKIKSGKGISLVTDKVIYNHFISFLKYIWNSKIIFQVLFHFFYKSNYELSFITALRFLCYIIHLILTNTFIHSKEDTVKIPKYNV